MLSSPLHDSSKSPEAPGQLTAWLDPAFFELVIERLYQEEGLLSADVNVLAQEIQDGASVVRVVIQEGEPWRIGRVTLGGAGLLSRSWNARQPRAAGRQSLRRTSHRGARRGPRAAVSTSRISRRPCRGRDRAQPGAAHSRRARARRARSTQHALIRRRGRRSP